MKNALVDFTLWLVEPVGRLIDKMLDRWLTDAERAEIAPRITIVAARDPE